MASNDSHLLITTIGTPNDFNSRSFMYSLRDHTRQPLAFVLDIRRLNVALSRAQCLAIVVMSPKLAQHSAGSLSQMERLSFACRLLEENMREVEVDASTGRVQRR